MGDLLRKLKKAKGAVTIEATLSLTMFLFMFIMIYSIITICRTQATIQVAINSTAKELSQYSYLYSITGLHDAMKNVAEGAEDTKQDVNEVAQNVSQVFTGIQSIKDNVTGIGDVNIPKNDQDLGAVMEELKTAGEGIKEGATTAKEGAKAAQKKLSDMLDPGEDGKGTYKLIFGMSKLMVSEGYEQAKSLAAEAISRVMVKKHLKRHDKDNAENFCRSAGIQPGEYFGEVSYFNGIDFSHSSMLPYKSNTITIVANYKMKLIQLIPVDFQFHFTQTAVTLAWVQGDVEVPDTPKEAVGQLSEDFWNIMDGSERERLIRKMGITELTKDGFSTVSGHDYVHGYSSKNPQTIAVIRSYNPLVGLTSVDKINSADLVDRLEKISSQVEASTADIHTINVKERDKNGNLKTHEVNCDGDLKRKVILVIPEDPGVQKKLEEALKQVETDVEFEFLPGYGRVFSNNATNADLEGT